MDQASGQGILRRDRISQPEDGRRPMPPHRAHQRAGQPRVGNQADASEGGHEARIVRRDDEVGGQRQADARAGGDAIHRRHDRLGQVADGADHGVVFGDQHAAKFTLPGATAQVGAGAEAASLPGQHHRANRGVAAGRLERREQLAAHRGVQGIEQFGASQGDGRDAIGSVKPDGGRIVGHVADDTAGIRMHGASSCRPPRERYQRVPIDW